MKYTEEYCKEKELARANNSIKELEAKYKEQVKIIEKNTNKTKK